LHDEQVSAKVHVDPDPVGHLVPPVGGKKDDAGQETDGGESAADEGQGAQNVKKVWRGEFTNVKQLFKQRFDACVNKLKMK
jgi:hypothetical protein